jgi:DNA-binding NarL/FixJ family response regulator
MSEGVISVAVIEDTEGIREALRVLINGSHGFKCEHAFQDAETALTELPSHEVDIVLMDINLPRMNGIDCMLELKKHMPHTHFMMSTVYRDDETIFSALESGATGYLLKHTSAAQVLEAIRELHDGGSPMSTEIARRVVEAMHKRKQPSELLAALTPREKEILDLLSKGYLYKEVADQLFISKGTVKKHIYNIYEKLHVQNRTEALNKAFRQ